MQGGNDKDTGGEQRTALPVPGLSIDLSVIDNVQCTPDGRLRLRHILAEGSEGEVYAAESPQGEKLVVKVYTGDEARLKLQLVLSLWEHLEHPHIVAHYGVQHDETRSYLEMEFCPGDLLGRISHAAGGKLSESEARGVLGQLVSAVSHLHSLGVYHRDLKPDNVLLKEGLQVRLTDLGTAVVIPPPSTTYELVEAAPGSPAYVPPEVLRLGLPPSTVRGRRVRVDAAKGDVWALGITLFAMVVGKTPWAQASAEDPAFGASVHAGTIRDMPPSLSLSLRDLLRGMLTFDASRRMTLQQVMDHAWLQE